MGIYKNGIVTTNDFNEYLLPPEYQQVEYIESSGTQYIDTGYLTKTSLKVIVTVELLSNLTSGNRAIFGGCEYNNKIYSQLCTNSNVNGWIIQWGNWTDYGVKDNNKHTHIVDIPNIKYTVDNTSYNITTNITANTTTGTIYLFAVNTASQGADRITAMKMYDFKIYDNEILVRNMIPCYRKSDSIIGMYDTVTKTFFTNSGTGTFTKGNSVDNTRIYDDKVLSNSFIEI